MCFLYEETIGVNVRRYAGVWWRVRWKGADEKNRDFSLVWCGFERVLWEMCRRTLGVGEVQGRCGRGVREVRAKCVSEIIGGLG